MVKLKCEETQNLGKVYKYVDKHLNIWQDRIERPYMDRVDDNGKLRSNISAWIQEINKNMRTTKVI